MSTPASTSSSPKAMTTSPSANSSSAAALSSLQIDSEPAAVISSDENEEEEDDEATADESATADSAETDARSAVAQVDDGRNNVSPLHASSETLESESEEPSDEQSTTQQSERQDDGSDSDADENDEQDGEDSSLNHNSINAVNEDEAFLSTLPQPLPSLTSASSDSNTESHASISSLQPSVPSQKRSSFSLATNPVTGEATIMPLDDPSIAQHYNELMAQNELLAKENRLFDSFLQRHSTSLVEGERSPKHARRARVAHEPTLSDVDRNRLALEEIEYRTVQLGALQTKSAEDISLLKAIAINLDIRMQELKKEAFEFQREVVMSAALTSPSRPSPSSTVDDGVEDVDEAEDDDISSGASESSSGLGAASIASASSSEAKCVVSSDVLVRWMNEKLKSRRSLISKLKVKTRNTRSQLRIAQVQLRAKEEQGDSLHSIDFHQLQIKNSQFNARIKERNELLMILKQTCANAINRLNEAKRFMHDQTVLNKTLTSDSRTKQLSLTRMRSEMVKVKSEIVDESNKISRSKLLQSNPDMPHVLDYVKQRMALVKMKHQSSNLSRKIEIARLKLNGNKNMTSSLSARSTVVPHKNPTILHHHARVASSYSTSQSDSHKGNAPFVVGSQVPA